MVFPVVGGTQDTGYEISNSLRFNASDVPELLITPSSDGNRKTWTMSLWTKRGAFSSTHQVIFEARNGDGGSSDNIKWENEQLCIILQDGTLGRLKSTAAFRDVSAWYHIVVAVDTTQGTNTDRVKIYVNNVQLTSFTGTNTYPSQNDDTRVNWSSADQQFGNARHPDNDHGLHGYLADVNLIDGQALTPSSFGETNDNGVWIPKKYTGSYGTNGFFLEFQQTGTSANSSGMGADTSGNDNHLTPDNLAATDVTTDTPTNNFCTMNPLYSYSGITFSEGNLQTNLGGSNHRWGTSTFFVANGKWYFECKLLSDSNYNSGPGVIAYGIDDPITTEGGGAGSKAEGWIYLSTNAGDLQHGGTQYGTASAATTNDILMVAFDVDNGKIWIGKNGTWSEGSNPSTGNGAVREDLGDASSGLFSPGVSGYAENMVFNFGNPPFSISSGNADANGYGNFEYAVPSGFYSLCTKNLAEYG
jgi:hypothetical protein